MILKLRIYKYTYINDIKKKKTFVISNFFIILPDEFLKKKKNKIVYLQGNIKDIFKTTIII